MDSTIKGIDPSQGENLVCSECEGTTFEVKNYVSIKRISKLMTGGTKDSIMANPEETVILCKICKTKLELPE